VRNPNGLPDYVRAALDGLTDEQMAALQNPDAEAGLTWFLAELTRADAPVSLVAKAMRIFEFWRAGDLQHRRFERLIGAHFLREVRLEDIPNEHDDRSVA
jgi:hypothetical protein